MGILEGVGHPTTWSQWVKLPLETLSACIVKKASFLHQDANGHTNELMDNDLMNNSVYKYKALTMNEMHIHVHTIIRCYTYGEGRKNVTIPSFFFI